MKEPCDLLSSSSVIQVVKKWEKALGNWEVYLKEFAWTEDVEEGMYRPFISNPSNDKYLFEIARLLLSPQPRIKVLFKSRQLRITWLCLHLLSWLSMRSNVKTALISEKYSQKASVLENKIQLLSRFYPPWFDIKPSKSQNLLVYPSGAEFWAFTEKATDPRGFTFSYAFLDEFAFHPRAEQVFSALLPSVQKGQIWIVSTPGEPGCFYNSLTAPSSSINLIMPGLSSYENEKGYLVIRVEHFADPSRDDRWLEDIRRYYPNDREFQREILLNTNVSSDPPVYVEFNNSHIAESSYDPTLPLVRGWDFGFVRSAVVYAQFQHRDNSWRILDAQLFEQKNVHEMYQFVEQRTSKIMGLEGMPWIVDFCDIAGYQRDVATGISPIDILSSPPYNLRFRAIKRSILDGIELIRILLRNGMLKVDPRCRLVVEAFKGGYCCKNDGIRNDGLYIHIMDALRYIIHNTTQFTDKDRSKAVVHTGSLYERRMTPTCMPRRINHAEFFAKYGILTG